MAKSPLILAALAKDAVSNLDFVQAQPLNLGHAERFDSALLTSSEGNHYVLRQALSHEAELELDTELIVLRALAPFRDKLPFDMVKLVGETRDSRGKRALLFTYVYGSAPELHHEHANSPLVSSLANALAAIHSLPLSVVENNGLPVYDNAAVVRERVSDLDRAAETGKVPAVLLDRWEKALEDVNIWRFQPTVIHSEASPTHFLTLDSEVSAVIGWDKARIGDPAMDFSWVQGYGLPDFSYSVLLEYERIRGVTDENLRIRAQLYAELAHVEYLIDGIRKNDEAQIEDAERFIFDLVEDIANGIVGPLGPKPLGVSAFEEFGSTDFGTSEFGNGAEFGNAGEFNAAEFGNGSEFGDSGFISDLGSPAGLVDAGQAIVSDDLFAESSLVMPVVEDAPQAKGAIASLFSPVVDDMVDFDSTAPIPLVAEGEERLMPRGEDTETRPISIVDEAEETKPNDRGELF